MIPVIALVGRPNVGKSTLFNRLTRSRDALVADVPGLTRDRQYGRGQFGEQAFVVIDTGGITGGEQGIDAAMARQTLQAVDEADLIFFMMDARDGLTAADQELARRLRQLERPVYYVVNKMDGIDPAVAAAEFYRLGIERYHAIAAVQGAGIRALMTDALAAWAPAEAPAGDEAPGDLAEAAGASEEDEAAPPKAVRLAVLGRPNVGKSTLINRMLGEERLVVFDQPGTTRDSIHIDFERQGRDWVLIDTAGVRRRRSVADAVEKFSIIKALQAMEQAHVVILVIDARDGIVEQDLNLLGHVLESGRALVVAVNKWDGLTEDHRREVRRELDRRLQFLDYAELHYISALHGTGVGHLYEAVERAWAAATRPLSTPHLTRLLEDAVAVHPPPLVAGRRIKLRYAHAGGSNPPRIVIHGNQVDKIPASYQRYLENLYRRELDLAGTPLKIEFRGGANPWAGRRNELTPRQLARRKRMMRHVKKRSR